MVFVIQKIIQLLEMIETWTLLKAFYLIVNNGTKQYANRIENVHIAAASEIVKTHYHHKNITHRFYDKYKNKFNIVFFFFFFHSHRMLLYYSFDRQNTTVKLPQQPEVIVSLCDVQIDKWINKSFNVGVTTFRNLSEFFPKKYFISKRYKDNINFMCDVCHTIKKVYFPSEVTVFRRRQYGFVWTVYCILLLPCSCKYYSNLHRSKKKIFRRQILFFRTRFHNIDVFYTNRMLWVQSF